MSSVPDYDLYGRRHPIKRGEPIWDLALFYPFQGDWTEEEYLDFETNQMIEYVDGCLEFLPKPTVLHQRIAQILFKLLEAWVTAQALDGEVFIAPLRVKTVDKRIRLPDVVYLRKRRIRSLRLPPRGADLAMEVVSEGKGRKRDLVEKRLEYAMAKIGEYWIVDPRKRTITVLVLEGERYRIHGEFKPGQHAASVLLPGFRVGVAAVFAAGKGRRA
jgi:Uma2 family endonuclease